MIPRTAERVIRSLLKGFPVLTITGPRQSGKTTLAKAVTPAGKGRREKGGPFLSHQM